MKRKNTVRASLIILLLVIFSFLSINILESQTTSNPSSNIRAILENSQVQTYGTGLSGAPVILDEPTLSSMTGGVLTVPALETLIQEYFIPMGIHLVFLDIGWGNDANTTQTLVAGGYQQWIANWLYACEQYGIFNLFFVKQFGYFFSAPSWDQDFLNAYPSASTVNASGINVPLLNCAGCQSSSGWTITSPYVYRQYEEDLKQLFKWYGQYTSWIGFGEGATGDRNYYGNFGTGLKTSRPWDNGTISIFANSIFFQRNINSTGYYISSGTLSKVWSMFLKDRPDIAESVGIVEPSTYQVNVYSGSPAYQRFYIPFGANNLENGFSLLAYIAKVGNPTAPLVATIYNDNGEFSNGTANIGNVTLASANFLSSSITSTLSWVEINFTAPLAPGDFYWVKFSSSTTSANNYLVTKGNYNPAPGISGSVLWIKSFSGQNITIYPILGTAANWRAVPGASVPFEVSSTVNVNTIAFYDSDRAYDPNNVSFYITNNVGTVIANGTMCSQCWRAYNSLHYVPFQLSKILTLVPGIKYQINFNALPSSDNWAGSTGGGVSQDFIADSCTPSTACYLGQSTFPVFELGLFSVDIQDSSLPYSPTDLFGSPGYQGNIETAVGFVAQATENLTKFEVNVIAAKSGSNIFNVTVRSDNSTIGHHPSKTILGTFTEALSSINSTFKSCPTTTGFCTWVNATFSLPLGVPLTAGNYYWIVMNTTGNVVGPACTVCLLRLNNGYQFPVYDSPNDFKTSWGVPPDGPSDLSFQIVTTGGDINNTVVGGSPYEFELGSFAQSFQVARDTQVKEIWSPSSPGTAYEQLNISIETDSGSDSPSGVVLGKAINSQMLSQPVNLTAGTKYWIVWSSKCLQVGQCSNPTKIDYTVFRSDASSAINYGGSSLHVDIYNTTSASWIKYPLYDTEFILMGSNSTINLYNTKTLYSEISTYDNQSTSATPLVGWNSFLNFEQSEIMYNLTQFLTVYSGGRQMFWYTGMTTNTVEALPNFNASYVLFGDSGAGGVIGCPPSDTSCGGSATFWEDDAGTHFADMMGYPNPSNWFSWSSFGNTADNRGDLTPIEMRDQYLLGVPFTATNPVMFNDWAWSTRSHGISNLTEQGYSRAFGTFLNRMQYNGIYFGSSTKSSVRVLWIGGSGDGYFPQFLTPAINLTLGYFQDGNFTRFGNFSNYFNVIVGYPQSPTPSFVQRYTAFVKHGGGIVDTSFGVSPNVENNFLGLVTNSTSVSPTSAFTILAPNNKITYPYTSISYSPYWIRYGISKLANESAQVLVQDSKGDPIITVNNYFSGIGVELEQPYDNLWQTGNGPHFEGTHQYGTPRDSWISLMINAIYYAAGKSNMLPILWESSYSDQQNWSPYLQFSIDGSPGKPVLLWLSSNDSSRSSFDIHLNATFYGVSTSGWIAVDMQNMSVIAKGSGSDIHIQTTVPSFDWEPIYIMNDTLSNLQSMYSTNSIVSSTVGSSSASYVLSGGENTSAWLILQATSPIVSVSSNATGTLAQYTSLVSLNATTIGYQCTVENTTSDTCITWQFLKQEGWYYDSANGLLYIHFEGSNALSLSLIQQTGLISTASSNTSSADSSISSRTPSSTITSGASTSASKITITFASTIASEMSSSTSTDSNQTDADIIAVVGIIMSVSLTALILRRYKGNTR